MANTASAASSSGTTTGDNSKNSIRTSNLPAPFGKRYDLPAMMELRFEVPFCNTKASITTSNAACQFVLQRGSCELWGCELALGKTYRIPTGGCKLALFTWHGCVIDVLLVSHAEQPYTSDETETNISFVNTHAQLEALRDEAAAAALADAAAAAISMQDSQQHHAAPTLKAKGPRVMIVGPPESGKSSLCKVLVAYACKVGRTPMWVDLDPVDNALSIPGTLAVAPMSAAAVTIETYATNGIPAASTSSSNIGNTTSAATPPTGVPPSSPLVVWHGSSSASSSNNNSGMGSKPIHPELFRAQVQALAAKIDQRLDGDDMARSSGIIVNTNGWMSEDDAQGYPLLLDTAAALDITVFLVMGQDKLYSRLTNHYKDSGISGGDTSVVKVIKLPRSGGVVSKPDIKLSKSRAVKRYFYGESLENLTPSSSSTGGASGGGPSDKGGLSSTNDAPTSSSGTLVPQLTPFLVQLSFADCHLYKVASISLSASLLPVAAAQSTDAIQLVPIHDLKDAGGEGLQHAVVAVAHPSAVSKYSQTQRARDLVTAGVAGFCVIERVNVDTDTLQLLSPCAGALPSTTLLLGDVTWME
jgi:polyribonucleotide 5'-hydroxyl-kinase